MATSTYTDTAVHKASLSYAFVCDHRFGLWYLVKQRARLSDVGLFSAGQCESNGITECIDDAVDFGYEAPARATQSLWAVLFSHRGVLVGTDRRAIEHYFLQITIPIEGFE